ILFLFQAEDGIRDFHVTGVQTCALPIWSMSTRSGPVTWPKWTAASAEVKSRSTSTTWPGRALAARAARDTARVVLPTPPLGPKQTTVWGPGPAGGGALGAGGLSEGKVMSSRARDRKS